MAEMDAQYKRELSLFAGHEKKKKNEHTKIMLH